MIDIKLCCTVDSDNLQSISDSLLTHGATQITITADKAPRPHTTTAQPLQRVKRGRPPKAKANGHAKRSLDAAIQEVRETSQSGEKLMSAKLKDSMVKHGYSIGAGSVYYAMKRGEQIGAFAHDKKRKRWTVR